MHILEISKSSSFAGHCSSGGRIQVETISLSAKVTLDVNMFQKSSIMADRNRHSGTSIRKNLLSSVRKNLVSYWSAF